LASGQSSRETQSPADAKNWHRRAFQRKAAKLVPHENVMSREEIIGRDDECYGHRRHQLLTRGRSSGCRNAPMISQQEEDMFTKATLGLAVILATASGALAVTKTHNVDPSHPASTNVYNPFGAYVGTAPDIIVRLWEREN
jgi:hypothetical protein